MADPMAYEEGEILEDGEIPDDDDDLYSPYPLSSSQNTVKPALPPQLSFNNNSPQKPPTLTLTPMPANWKNDSFEKENDENMNDDGSEGSYDSDSYESDSSDDESVYDPETGALIPTDENMKTRYHNENGSSVSPNSDDFKRRRAASRLKRRARRPQDGEHGVKKKFKKTTCRFYMDGKCQKGPQCTFSHDCDVPKKEDVCKFYLQGHCQKGDNCNFMHGEFPCKFFHTGVECYKNDMCRFSHAPLDEHSRRILDNYLKSDSKEQRSSEDQDQQEGEFHHAGGNFQAGYFRYYPKEEPKPMTEEEYFAEQERLMVAAAATDVDLRKRKRKDPYVIPAAFGIHMSFMNKYLENGPLPVLPKYAPPAPPPPPGPQMAPAQARPQPPPPPAMDPWAPPVSYQPAMPTPLPPPPPQSQPQPQVHFQDPRLAPLQPPAPQPQVQIQDPRLPPISLPPISLPPPQPPVQIQDPRLPPISLPPMQPQAQDPRLAPITLPPLPIPIQDPRLSQMDPRASLDPRAPMDPRAAKPQLFDPRINRQPGGGASPSQGSSVITRQTSLDDAFAPKKPFVRVYPQTLAVYRLKPAISSRIDYSAYEELFRTDSGCRADPRLQRFFKGLLPPIEKQPLPEPPMKPDDVEDMISSELAALKKSSSSTAAASDSGAVPSYARGLVAPPAPPAPQTPPANTFPSPAGSGLFATFNLPSMVPKYNPIEEKSAAEKPAVDDDPDSDAEPDLVIASEYD